MRVLARFDLTARVNAVVSGQEVASPKPAPDIFLAAATALGVPAARAAIVEDAVAGIEAAGFTADTGE